MLQALLHRHKGPCGPRVREGEQERSCEGLSDGEQERVKAKQLSLNGGERKGRDERCM